MKKQLIHKQGKTKEELEEVRKKGQVISESADQLIVIAEELVCPDALEEINEAE